MPLISVPPNSALAKTFQDGLRKRGTSWEIGIELSTLEMVQTYCAAGYGIGLSILAPGIQYGSDLRVIGLKDFPLVKIAAFWQEPLSPVPALFMEEIKKEALKQRGTSG
jgi:DNA-binding transcriptional LysR family regulator